METQDQTFVSHQTQPQPVKNPLSQWGASAATSTEYCSQLEHRRQLAPGQLVFLDRFQTASRPLPDRFQTASAGISRPAAWL